MSRRSSWSFSVACIASWAAIALGLGATITAEAGSAVISWTAPTQNEDGTPLTDLSGYRILYGTTSTTLTQSKQLTDASLRSYTVDNLPAGKWYFAMTALAGASPVRESAQTNVVSKDIAAGLTVKEPKVYQIVGTLDHVNLIDVGTVPVGTPCDATQSVLGRYVVPRAAVTWYGAVKPQAVVAVCE